MRLLFTFLFLSMMHSFLVFIKEKANIFITKISKKLVKIQSYQILTRINHHIFNKFTLAKYQKITKKSCLIILLKSTENINDKIDFYYRYIFNYLYLKSTFGKYFAQ